MFQNDELKSHLESSNTIKTQSAIIAEWNMNIADNIFRIGNYRYRPALSNDIKYRLIPNTFDVNDSGNFYTNATNSDIKIDGGIDPVDNEEPWFLLAQNTKNKMLYSLEDCFKKFRPRSGINKVAYLPGKKLHHSNMNMSNRPRYYMADKNDKFKYWTSYRTENGSVYGIANKILNGQHYIDDACPFVVYNNEVPANRIVIKMQTNIGSVDLGPFSNSSGSLSDPLFGDTNKTTPVKWKIQYLKKNEWIDIINFNSSSTRKDGTPIIKHDGYVELAYGLKVPDKYKDIFIRAEEYYSESFLPKESINGYSYLIKQTDNDIGVYYIWFNGDWETFVPEYGWYLEEETVTRLTNFVTDFTNPVSFVSSTDSKTMYREFENIRGIRVVVDTMNKVNSTFDLIEMSPRLVADISDKAVAFSVKKSASDLGTSGLPVGQLLASVGSLTLFDYDNAFNENNTGSIINKYLANNMQIKFYDIVIDVKGYDYLVPIKPLYCEGFPKYNPNDRKVNLELRDLYFYFESIKAPEVLVTNVSLSYAVSLLLDSIGFSNYSFKRIDGEKELIIPFFYIAPDKTVAEILNDLAVSTQTAMFFDEYNNFIMMSKNYMLPSNNERSASFTFHGSKDFEKNGSVENKTTNVKLANIIDIASTDKNVFNDGKINYNSRYIQRSYGTIKQASMIDNEASAKNWIYKPALLWEITGDTALRSINGEVASQSAYSLAAIPLNSNLSASPPVVIGNRLFNNTIDLGEAVYWLGRHSGYFYANGEIIRFDAVQYSIPGAEKIIAREENNGKVSFSTTTVGAVGNVWISSNQEYQNYMSKLTFNGKIYPTGLVRIYAEPKYEEINGITVMKNGEVTRHGRGQFGTPIVNHNAGLNEYWTNNNYVRGMNMKSKYLFGLEYIGQTQNELLNSMAEEEVFLSVGPAGINNSKSKENNRTGVIKNFLSTSFTKETQNNTIKSTQTGSVQSSALVMSGPPFGTTERPIDFISYQYKALDNKFKHFGTRMRIVGKIESSETRGQTPINSTPYYVLPGSQPNQSLNISGGSGGISVLLNPDTNVGYYFEIISLTEKNVSEYSSDSENLHNVVFYKILSDEDNNAIPVKLWGGFTNIIVDSGNFTGQSRLMGEENPTVYDLAVEYQDIASIRRFFLYINNQIISIVDDTNPLPIYNNMALFVRGGSKCMFENVYALTNNYSQNTVFALDTPVSAAFGDDEINANESFRKYSMSGIIQSTYLSGISPNQPPKFSMYFEEFGTIMREASYLKIRYDKAYPALYAQLSPTFNRIKGYSISGFRAGSYGAEFLIFNSTDTTLNLDETSGNYLRIQGITFTQQSQNELTVDNYFAKNSNFSDPEIGRDGLIISPIRSQQDYDKIKTSRLTYGKKEFSIEPIYIQSEDDAKDLMSWLIQKIMKPRKSVGIQIFNTPIVQLGDIVNINYKNENSEDIISSDKTNFVVYNIDYQKGIGGPSMTLYLSEV